MPTVKMPLRAVQSSNRTSRWNFAEWFILSQTFLPALLYLPGTQPLRVPIRVASYGISLAALICYLAAANSRARILSRLHPSTPWLLAAVVYLGLMVFHPTTNSLLSGLAQVCLYVAILAPVLWAQTCVDDPRRLRCLLWLLLVCNGINSFVGVMQVRDPNTWMPREFSSVFMDSEFGLGTVVYEGANGNMVIRPPGFGGTHPEPCAARRCLRSTWGSSSRSPNAAGGRNWWRWFSRGWVPRPFS